MPQSNTSHNHFELRLKDGVAKGVYRKLGQIELLTEIWIDGQYLDEPHLIDLPELIRSVQGEGWYEIFTCVCSVGRCAGIPEGIRVTRSDNNVQWSFRRPQSAGNLMDPAISRWESTAVPLELSFVRSQMLEAIQKYLDGVRDLVGAKPHGYCWPVFGLYVQDVLKMSPLG